MFASKDSQTMSSSRITVAVDITEYGLVVRPVTAQDYENFVDGHFRCLRKTKRDRSWVHEIVVRRIVENRELVFVGPLVEGGLEFAWSNADLPEFDFMDGLGQARKNLG